VNYGFIYAFKAIGGSFAGGIAALIMSGTIVGSAHFHWARGFIFGVVLAAPASVVIYFKCKPPTVEDWETAVAKATAVESAVEAVPAPGGIIAG
jgi:hypothetical protein